MFNLKLQNEIKLSKYRSQEALCQEINIESSQFSRYIHGWRPMPQEVKELVAKALEKPMEELFPV